MQIHTSDYDHIDCTVKNKTKKKNWQYYGLNLKLCSKWREKIKSLLIVLLRLKFIDSRFKIYYTEHAEKIPL